VTRVEAVRQDQHAAGANYRTRTEFQAVP
jgi:hypothetical protein